MPSVRRSTSSPARCSSLLLPVALLIAIVDLVLRSRLRRVPEDGRRTEAPPDAAAASPRRALRRDRPCRRARRAMIRRRHAVAARPAVRRLASMRRGLAAAVAARGRASASLVHPSCVGSRRGTAGPAPRRPARCATGLARPGHVGRGGAPAPADHDAARPERPAVLARLAARPHRRDGVLRLPLQQACPLEGRALAAAERALPARAAAGARGRQRQPARHAGEHARGAARSGGWPGRAVALAAWRPTPSSRRCGSAYHIFVAPPSTATSPTPRPCI